MFKLQNNNDKSQSVTLNKLFKSFSTAESDASTLNVLRFDD